MPGPPPKRSDMRRRRNVRLLTKAPAGSAPTWPEPPEHWHHIARQCYDALQTTGMRAFFEASDIASAYLQCEAVDRLVTASKFSAELLGQINSGLARLGFTESDRRRAGVELTRDANEPPSASAMRRYRLAAGDGFS